MREGATEVRYLLYLMSGFERSRAIVQQGVHSVLVNPKRKYIKCAPKTSILWERPLLARNGLFTEQPLPGTPNAGKSFSAMRTDSRVPLVSFDMTEEQKKRLAQRLRELKEQLDGKPAPTVKESASLTEQQPGYLEVLMRRFRP